MRGRSRQTTKLDFPGTKTLHYQSLVMAWTVGAIGQWPLDLGLLWSLVGLDERFVDIKSMQAKAF